MLSALLFISAKVAVADASAGVGADGFNPQGQYCPGQTIEVREMANAYAGVDMWGSAGYATTSREAHFTDELLGAGDIIGGGNGTVVETCHGYLFLEGQQGIGAWLELSEEHIGEYTGIRWASALAIADDGVNHVELKMDDCVEYTYTVAPCWAFPPDEAVNPPDVLDPDEISG